MGTTFDEIIDILDKWQFMLGQRAGRELWIDKPTDIQEEDLANFNRNLETVRSFVVKNNMRNTIDYIDTAFEEQSRGSSIWYDEFGREYCEDVGYAYQWWEECMKPQLERVFMGKE